MVLEESVNDFVKSVGITVLLIGFGGIGYFGGHFAGIEEGRKLGKREVLQILEMEKNDRREFLIYPIKTSAEQDTLLEEIGKINYVDSLLKNVYNLK